MMQRRTTALAVLVLAVLPALAAAAEPDAAALAALGHTLFHDASLSRDGSVSCATCHDPARAWSDARNNAFGAAVSLGIAATPGLRNAPSLAYAALVPPPGTTPEGLPQGGLFWDGRSASLEAQAGGPLFNPREMGLPDAEALRARLLQSPAYPASFAAVFGSGILDAADRAVDAVAAAIAAYERGPDFVAFDSRYDRYLRGEYTPTPQEVLGMGVFFTPEFSNCSVCHQLQPLPESARELFSNHGYENIGVPANPRLSAPEPDEGLGAATGAVPGAAQRGRFRVPTLRNVAVTAPYMHNGVFADLRTVVLFYNKYVVQGQHAQLNPETGAVWGEPEVAENVAHEKLRTGLSLSPRAMDALVAFLQMLTDARFEQASATPGVNAAQSVSEQPGQDDVQSYSE